MKLINYAEINFEKKFFLLGALFLLTAPILSLIFFLVSIILVKFKNQNEPKKEIRNKDLLWASFFMILSCIFQGLNLQTTNHLSIGYDISLSWVGLLNWFPLFISFYFLKPFVDDPKDRKLFLITILIGSAPIMIFIGLSQYFKLYDGNLNLFNGLIRWFSFDYDSWNSGIAINPIFSNPNYSASWILISWITTLYLLEFPKTFFKKITYIFLLLGIFTILLLTRSTNAYLGLFLSFPVYKGIKSIKVLSKLSILSVFIIFLITIFGNVFFSELNFNNIISSLQTRIIIWKETIFFILQKPIIGWGASSYPLVFEKKIGYIINHAHNLPLELAYSYGLPCTFIIFRYLYIIPLKAYLKIIQNHPKNFKDTPEHYIDLLWVSTTLILLFTQLLDIHYYDGRFSIVIWILISGSQEILKNSHKIDSDKSK